MSELTIERLKELFLFDPDSGVLTWLPRVIRPRVEGTLWNTPHAADKSGNAKYAGKVAGHTGNRGWRWLTIDGLQYREHRVIWFFVEGAWPKGELDHINGNRADNRRCNLREATHTQNMQNMRRQTDNKSGYKGVCWDKGHQKWHAYMSDGNGKMRLGFFDTPDLAALTYAAAAKKYHGEFAHPTLPDVVHEIVFGKGKQFEKQVLRNLADLSIYST